MVKAISKSANQPNDMPLTIYIFTQSFSTDKKLETDS